MQTALVQPWQATGSAETDRRYVRFLPSLTDFAFLLPLSCYSG